MYNVDSQKVTNRLVYTKAKLGAVQCVQLDRCSCGELTAFAVSRALCRIDPIHSRVFLGTYEKAVVLFQLNKPTVSDCC